MLACRIDLAMDCASSGDGHSCGTAVAAFGRIWISLTIAASLSGYSPAAQTGYTPAQITSCLWLECDHVHVLRRLHGARETARGDDRPDRDVPRPEPPVGLEDVRREYSLPNPTLTVVDQAGKQTDSGWALEESMDVEWAHAIAPGANILVVEAAPSNSADPGTAKPVERGEHGTEHGGRRGGLDELGIQRDAQ